MALSSVIRRDEKAEGRATVLAIGTANPPNAMQQSSYPDFYFNITNSNHLADLKNKQMRICSKSGIRKRHLFLTEEILKENPCLCTFGAPSLNVRQDIAIVETPKLGKEAALKAIEEWGQPRSKITHLVFCTRSGLHMPGSDATLVNLLGLQPNVKRLMIYQQGCFGGGTVLRAAKDLAENNKGARVLVVCSELTVLTFHGPTEFTVVNQALFGDGAGALIIGADPIPALEHPLFEFYWAGSSLLPDSDGAIQGALRECGLIIRLTKGIPSLISSNIRDILEDAFCQTFGHQVDLRSVDLNDMFWIVHPGGRSILDQIEGVLKLTPDKLLASRAMLADYGNMISASVSFIMDYMRKKSQQEGATTTGEGHEWGVLISFGPGITVETLILRSCTTRRSSRTH